MLTTHLHLVPSLKISGARPLHPLYAFTPWTALSLTYLLTPWCSVLLEKLTGLQLVKKFPAFYGTRRFITALTSVRHLSLSCASPIQSTYPHPTSWRSLLILSTHLCLGLPSGLFPSGFPTKTLHTPLTSPIRATCPAHLILLKYHVLKILVISVLIQSGSWHRLWLSSCWVTLTPSSIKIAVITTSLPETSLIYLL